MIFCDTKSPRFWEFCLSCFLTKRLSLFLTSNVRSLKKSNKTGKFDVEKLSCIKIVLNGCKEVLNGNQRWTWLSQMNVKDQGRLLRQDNFTVWNGKKKHQRRVFLLDDLVIFSKVRKQPGGVDLYYYKNSLKVTWLVPLSGRSVGPADVRVVPKRNLEILYFLYQGFKSGPKCLAWAA